MLYKSQAIGKGVIFSTRATISGNIDIPIDPQLLASKRSSNSSTLTPYNRSKKRRVEETDKGADIPISKKVDLSIAIIGLSVEFA